MLLGSKNVLFLFAEVNVFLFVFIVWTLISVQGENRFGLITKFRSWVVYILTHSVSFIKQLFKTKTSLLVFVSESQYCKHTLKH